MSIFYNDTRVYLLLRALELRIEKLEHDNKLLKTFIESDKFKLEDDEADLTDTIKIEISTALTYFEESEDFAEAIANSVDDALEKLTITRS